MSTIWQDNAALAAHTPEPYLEAQRRDGVRRALDLIVAGQPGRAYFVLVRSVMAQARVAGLGHVEVPACPCGGRCARGLGGGGR